VLRQKLISLARERPRFGYRRLHVLLEREGQTINHKRVWRVYKAAGLSVKRTRRKKLIRSLRPALLLHAANQEWAVDFASDVMHAGRTFRVFSVVDSFTRECLALEVDTSMGSHRLTRVLDQIIEQRGLPLAIRSDNGPELTSRHFLAWSIERQVDLIHIQPGKPVQNAHVESFHGRLRDECLNVSWFWNLFDARRKIEEWRRDYNGHRPHSSLGYRTPAEFARQVATSPSAFSGSAPPGSPQGQALRAASPALTRPRLRAQAIHQEGEAALHCGGELG
jgi:putative transposase